MPNYLNAILLIVFESKKVKALSMIAKIVTKVKHEISIIGNSIKQS
jgi:hypothetical protein